MKTTTLIPIFLILSLCTGIPLFQSACQQAPSARVVQVQTLLAVGQSAEGAVALSAQLYRDGKITPTQARQVLDFYNGKFQPAYRAAVTVARSDLSSLASPDVLALAAELSALVLQFYPPKTSDLRIEQLEMDVGRLAAELTDLRANTIDTRRLKKFEPTENSVIVQPLPATWRGVALPTFNGELK